MIIAGSIALYFVGLIIGFLMMANGPTFLFLATAQHPRLGYFLADFRIIVGSYLNAFFVALVMRYIFDVTDGQGQVQWTVLVMSFLPLLLFAIGESPLIPVTGWILGPVASWFAVDHVWAIVGGG
jgi:hypothetical protein